MKVSDPDCLCEGYPCDYAASERALALARMLHRVAGALERGQHPIERADEVRDIAAVMGEAI